MTIVVVMGVSGCGKSTVASLLANRLECEYLEGDDLHSRSNVEKMSHGIPLTDDDRWPWLKAISAWIEERANSNRLAVVSCSSLKRSYRNVLRGRSPTGAVIFAHLTGSRQVLEERLRARRGHFMPANLLDSQLATLEPLEADEAGIAVDVALSPNDATMEIIRRLDLI